MFREHGSKTRNERFNYVPTASRVYLHAYSLTNTNHTSYRDPPAYTLTFCRVPISGVGIIQNIAPTGQD